MRHTGILFIALSAALLLGCDKKATSPPGSSSKTSTANEKVGEAADAAVIAAKAKRDEYAGGMQKILDELDVKYKELEKRAADAKDDSKKDLDKKAKEAKAKRDAAAKKLDELKKGSHDRWEKGKDGVDSAFDDLKKAFE